MVKNILIKNELYKNDKEKLSSAIPTTVLHGVYLLHAHSSILPFQDGHPCRVGARHM